MARCADLAVETGAPVREAAIVLRLVNERIEALVRSPRSGLWLRHGAPAPCPGANRPSPNRPGSWPLRTALHELAALLDRLGSERGARRFCRLAPQGSHVPELETQLGVIGRTARWWDAPLPGEPPLRPLTLFDPPERIEVLAAVPDGPPRQFRWRGSAHRIVARKGPSRIAPEWRRRPGGHEADPGSSRDYYRVEDEGGGASGCSATASTSARPARRIGMSTGCSHERETPTPFYAELACTTAYSFCMGPARQGTWPACRGQPKNIGVADRNTVSGVVRAKISDR